MDEFVADFLAETRESLDILDSDVLTLEKTPDDPEIVGNIFRVMHTIKGTCGFLGLGRLESVAHAGENVLDKIRNNELHVDPPIVSAILTSIDRIKELLDALEEQGDEPSGKDDDVITKLNACLEAPGNDNGPVTPKAPEPKPEPIIEEKEAESHGPDIDSDDLQALFDATPCEFDFNQDNAPEPAPAPVAQKKEEAPKKEPTKAAKAPEQAIRVSLDTLEKLMQHASELVLTRNQLMQILRRNENSAFATALQRLNHITTDLQEQVMKTRMQPIGNAWSKLPRIIRDLSMELDKKIELVMEGEDTELDRQLLECIRDPLTHMIRNSADHGVESPEKRLAAGKPETGTINLKAYQGGGYIIVEIIDDGAGIPPDKIRAKILEKNLATPQDLSEMSDEQVIQYIFMPGFSTAEKITSVSGRGVGMDVVKTNIEKISGSVHLKSEVGKGSVFTIKIPLTLAIMPILEVGCGDQHFALPQISVVEVVKTRTDSDSVIEYINDSPVLRLRDNIIPLVFMREALGIKTEENKNEPKYIVICALGDSLFGVVVDKVYDVEEIVVKPVASKLKDLEVYSGCTILGNGSVILILDTGGLARSVGAFSGDAASSGDAKKERKDDERAVSFVVFEAGDSTPKAVPLELLSRLENIDKSRIEHSQGNPVLQYRGDWMRIVFPDGGDGTFHDEGDVELLVFNDRGNTIGLVVDRIIDIVRCPITRRMEGARKGYVGSVVVNDRTCDVIDVNSYFDAAFPELRKNDPINFDSCKGKRVLLVDDSPFFRKVISRQLKECGFVVSLAENGKKALDYLENNEVDVVVTDLTMPVMSGDKLAEAVRLRPNTKDLPIIAFSSWNVEQRGMPENEAFNCFVPKTRHQELHSTLQRLCAAR